MKMPSPLSRLVTERQKARWEALRTKGPFWFVFGYGILTAGLMFATLTTLSDYFGLFGVHWRGAKAEIFHFIFSTLFFGIAMGSWVWYVGEKRFRSTMTGGSPPPECK
jgi:hypothetical protein